jgi:hypothetical protein
LALEHVGITQAAERMEIVCDASELTAVFGAEAPDTFVTAGYSIPSRQVVSLIQSTERIKEELLGNRNVPIKWNVKDLERGLELHGLSELLPKIKERSHEVRKALLESLIHSGATLFVSVILAYSNRRQVLGESKDDLVRYCFGNFLMRTGLFCKDKSSSDVQLIVDWPDKDRRRLFVEEFHSGWSTGKSVTGSESINYHSGPLSSLGFRAGLLFGVTDVDVRLQLADLLVGACRSFISYCMNRVSETDFGVQQFKAIAPYLDRADGWKCFGRGITAAPANSDFSKTILDGFNALGC